MTPKTSTSASTERVTLPARVRSTVGTPASRRLRREGRVPGVVYGGGGPVVHVEVSLENLETVLRAHRRVVHLELDGSNQNVLLREVTLHPIKDHPLHIDFLRVSETSRVRVRIPLQFEGNPKGVSEGGEFVHTLAELEVECLPGDIPDSISVPVGGLLVGQTMTVADLAIPPRVTVLPDPTTVVCLVQQHGVEEAEPAVEEPTPTEPERIGRKPGEPEEEAEEGEK